MEIDLRSATDTEMLNWLEKHRAKVEPEIGNDSWIGIFWNGNDCGGNTIRQAILAAMEKARS